MSSKSKRTLIARIHMLLRAIDADIDRIEDAAASRVGVDRSAFRCLDILSRGEAVTPGRLAREAGLTTGAMTALLDRLERVRYVRRRRDVSDRRRVLVEPTPRAVAKVWPVFEGLLAESTIVLRRFESGELAAILRFLELSQDVIRRAAARVVLQGTTPRPQRRTRAVM